jgi:parallel beta-helix repeat protein
VYDSGASLWRVVGSASAVGGGVYVNLQGSTPGTADVGNFNITGTGIAANLQGTTSIKTPLVDVVSAGTLSIGTATATAVSIANTGVTTTVNGALTVTQASTFNATATFNSSVILAANQILTLTGGVTGSRPVTPTEGTMFYDTTTKRILSYSNGKWQADRADALYVAASNSTQADKDAADYIATGTSDQTTINTALTAASGRKVYLFAGTYTTDNAISIPNNTTLAGSGSGTLIQFANINTLTRNMIVNTDTSTGTGVTIRDLRLDGNKTTNTSGVQHAISFTGMGAGTGSSARQGALVTGVTATSFRGENIYLSGSSNNRFTNVVSQDSAIDGMQLVSSSNNNVITGSKFQGNGDNGLLITTTSSGNTLTGNNAQGNTTAGFQVINSSDNTLGSNTSNGNSQYGFVLSVGAANNAVSANSSQGNTVGGFNVVGTSNTLTGNTVNGGTIGFNITGANNTVSGNTVQGNTQGIFVGGNHTNVSANTVNSSSSRGIYLNGSDFSVVSSNKVYDTGTTTTNNGIYIQTSDSTNITGNVISDGTGTTNCSTNCYAIFIFNSTSDNTYLADNQLGNGSINDLGTGTIYGGQANASGNYQVQPAGTIELMKNTNVTGNLAVTGTGSFTGGSVTVATATATDDRLVVSVATGGAARFDGTITNADLTAARTWTLPNESGVICIVGSTSCLSGAGFVQLAPASVQADTSTNSSIFINKTGASGNLIQLQKSALDLFVIANNGSIQLGSVTNGISLAGTGGDVSGPFTLNGAARNTKKILLTPEYAGAVLDAASDTGGANCATNNNGTMTSGFDSASRMNNYQWTSTQTTDQCYDVVVQVPIPSDWSAWDATDPINVQLKKNAVGSAAYAIGIVDSAGSADANYGAAYTSPGTLTTSWGDMATSSLSGTYTAGNYMTIKIRMTAKQVTAQNGILYLGNITLTYLSKF